MSYAAYLRKLHKPALSIGYACSQCSSFLPLRHLYFCTDCQLLLCPCCTTAHVDTYYCPTCLTSVFSSSAQSSLGRCDQCTECPVCQHTLQTAFHSSSQHYSFICANCKWSSVDRNNPTASHSLSAADVTVLLSQVRARESNEAARTECQRLIAHYKTLHKQYQQEKKQEKHLLTGTAALTLPLSSFPSASSSPSAVTSSALYQSIAASRAGVEHSSPLQRFLAVDELVNRQRHDQHYHVRRLNDGSKPTFTAVPGYVKGEYAVRGGESGEQRQEERKDKPEPEPVRGLHDGQHMSTLSARLSHPAAVGVLQSTQFRYLSPRRRPLLTKLAHRCPKCTKYVLKPGPGAGKAAYEIEHVAYTCVPRVTVSDYQTLSVGQPARITLVVRNTVEREISVRLTAVTSAAAADVWSVLPSVASCDVRLSDEWVWLPAYDEIAEESGILQEQKRPDDAPSDNPSYVLNRSLSRVGLLLSITPLSTGVPVQFGVILEVTSASSTTSSSSPPLRLYVRFELGTASAQRTSS